MSGLFAALNASAQSLGAFQRAIDVSQNNVNNASTAGYAAELTDFTALSFNADSGLAGGVNSAASSTRSPYLDESVRIQTSNLGVAQQLTQSVAGIEPLFDVSGTTGVPAALTKLFNSFSALSAAPASGSSREAIVAAAQQAATAFQQTASALSQASAKADSQVQSQLNQVAALSAEVRGYNVAIARSNAPDAGRDAKLNAALEKLSALANISTRTNPSGATDVLLNGQIPLVLGTQQFTFSSSPAPAPPTAPPNPSGTPALQILDNNGQDVTAQFASGTIAGVLQFRNTIVPKLRGDTTQAGSLNTLAKTFADRVNALLTTGVIAQGPPAQPGVPLFTYDTSDLTKSAGSLAVVPGFTASQIATIDPGPPAVSNGIALTIGNVLNGSNVSDQINGFAYVQFFGEIAGGVGRQLATQRNAADLNQQALTQAQSIRSQLSGVSLDAEAVRLLQYQKSYSANAKLITVLDQIAQTTLDILK